MTLHKCDSDVHRAPRLSRHPGMVGLMQGEEGRGGVLVRQYPCWEVPLDILARLFGLELFHY
jgi:hypothetical protein